MTSRQYIRLSVKEIERLFERAPVDAATLDGLIRELDHRSVPRAKELRQRIVAARRALNAEIGRQSEWPQSSLCYSSACSQRLFLLVPFCPFCGSAEPERAEPLDVVPGASQERMTWAALLKNAATPTRSAASNAAATPSKFGHAGDANVGSPLLAKPDSAAPAATDRPAPGARHVQSSSAKMSVGRIAAVAVVTGLVLWFAVRGFQSGSDSAQSSPAPDSIRDCAGCPEMVRVPVGSVTVGAAPGEDETEGTTTGERESTAPQIRISIGQPLMVGRFEVTRGEFQRFALAPASTGIFCDGLNSKGGWENIDRRNWREPGISQNDQHPVVCVNFGEISDFLSRLSQASGRRYRLPTEAEWEYFARGGRPTTRYWGDDRSPTCRFANVADQVLANSGAVVRSSTNVFNCEDGYAMTAPVGRFRANPFGLHDVLGNVWEWTEDCWSPSLYGLRVDGKGRSGDCRYRAVRGGSWFSVPRTVRAAHRFRVHSTHRDSSVGFRVVRDN